MGDRPGEDALHDGPVSGTTALGSGRRAEPVGVLAQGEGAVRLLRDAGRPAASSEDGSPEWAGAGLPVERARA